jgi:hypothetical protein
LDSPPAGSGDAIRGSSRLGCSDGRGRNFVDAHNVTAAAAAVTWQWPLSRPPVAVTGPAPPGRGARAAGRVRSGPHLAASRSRWPTRRRDRFRAVNCDGAAADQRNGPVVRPNAAREFRDRESESSPAGRRPAAPTRSRLSPSGGGERSSLSLSLSLPAAAPPLGAWLARRCARARRGAGGRSPS